MFKWSVLIVAVFGLFTGCGPEQDKARGGRGEPCLDDGACDQPYVCDDGVCRDDPEPEPGEPGEPSKSTSRLMLERTAAVANGENAIIVTLFVKDSSGIALSEVTVQFSVSGAENVLNRTQGDTDDAGVLETALTSTKAEEKVITADVADGLFALRKTVRFMAGPPSRLTKVSGDEFTGTVAREMNTPLEVELLDEHGNPVAGNEVSFAIVESPEGATGQSVSSTLPATNRDGRAWAHLTFGIKAGIYRVAASATGLDGVVVFGASAEAAQAATMARVGGDDQTGTVAVSLEEPFIVEVLDPYYNPVNGHLVAFALIEAPYGMSGHELSEQEVATNAGLAETLLRFGDKPGTYVVHAVSEELEGSPVVFEADCLCMQDEQCEVGEYCSVDGRCLDWICEPGTFFCEGDWVSRCDEQGAGSKKEMLCREGRCFEGECSCEDAAHCHPGEECVEQVCECESGMHCGIDNACCPLGYLCEEHVYCDGDDCREVPRCLVQCDGVRCGAAGELCCEGETPVCHPTNVCVRDCGDQEPCGDELQACCGEDELCVFGACQAPGASCESFIDCGFDEYCEPVIGRCLPNDLFEHVECHAPQKHDPFDVEVVWHWPYSPAEMNPVTNDYTWADHGNVMGVPVTADMNGDGIPNVVIQGYRSLGDAKLFVIDGVTGQTIYVNDDSTFHGSGHTAVADVNGDGYPEIATTLGTQGVGLLDNIVSCPDPAPDNVGCFLWKYESGTLARHLDGAAPMFVDLKGDGEVQLIIGSVVLDALTGTLIADGGEASNAQGTFGGQFHSIAADITGNGRRELLTGGCAWSVNFEQNRLDEVWCNDRIEDLDGFPAVGDLTGDGSPEIVVVRSGEVFVLDNEGHITFVFQLPEGDAGTTRNHGGPPTIADFDGDGRPGIGVAGKACYTVFDLDCRGGYNSDLGIYEDLPGCIRPTFPECTPGWDCIVEPCVDPFVNPSNPHLVHGTGDGILWSVATHNISSTTTGSSVFDFGWSGRSELMYNDECRALVMDGSTGRPLLSLPNSTRTNSEYPIVVDVTGNGRTELVLVANNDAFDRDCGDLVAERPDLFPACHFDEDGNPLPTLPCPDPPDPLSFCCRGTKGIVALRDAGEQWVRTRSIWNQHAYGITNINADAGVPANPAKPWEIHNTYRGNQRGEPSSRSPNPALISLHGSTVSCPPAGSISAVVANDGTRGIAGDLRVSLYRIYPEETILLETTVVDRVLLPGERTLVQFEYDVPEEDIEDTMTFRVVANDDGFGGKPIMDCDPEMNEAELELTCTTGGLLNGR